MIPMEGKRARHVFSLLDKKWKGLLLLLFRVKRELSGSKIAYGKKGKDRMKHGIDVGRGSSEG